MDEFDNLIHSPTRLRIMALLSGTNSASFAYLQDVLGITPQNLSKNLKILADHGCIFSMKRRGAYGQETIVHATGKGLAAFQRHKRSLLRLLTDPENA
ncbi:transcriptional regulator [Austwickia chelonae]|uniref:transcriptional regulator n=1 Tax=Austwickia chelonae TaxID=100225 RepID=UPI0013C2B9D2|nr:transcriptional regulator [Austwickia chelonae]